MAEGEGTSQPGEQWQGASQPGEQWQSANGESGASWMQGMMMQMMQMMPAKGEMPQQMMQMMQQWGSDGQTGAAQHAPEWSKGGGKGKGKNATPSDNLYIRGLPSPQVDPEMLIRLFNDLGLNVTRHKLIPDTRGVGSSAAMVQLASVEEAQRAIAQLSGQEHLGNMLQLSFVESKSAPPGGGYQAQGRNQYLKVHAKDDGRGDNIFIGGLPSPTVDQAALNNVFESRGLTVVRSRLLPDTRGNGISCALVQLASLEEAQAAIQQLNGQPAEVLNLAAVELLDGLDPSKLDHNKMPIHSNLFVGNIPKQFNEQDVVELFKQCGTIKSCRISRHAGGESKGSGFVKFATKEEAKIAIGLLQGMNNLVVKPADFDVPDDGAGKGKEVPPWFTGGKGGWGMDNWGMEAKTIPPPMRAANQLLTFETEMICSFAGENGEDSDTLLIMGLPSPAVEEQRLLEVFTGVGVIPAMIEIVPDETDSQSSGAMVQFASTEAASKARTAVEGKKPSQLGLSAKGRTNGAKGKPSYGKGATPRVIPGPYSQGGKDAAKDGWNSGSWN